MLAPLSVDRRWRKEKSPSVQLLWWLIERNPKTLSASSLPIHLAAVTATSLFDCVDCGVGGSLAANFVPSIDSATSRSLVATTRRARAVWSAGMKETVDSAAVVAAVVMTKTSLAVTHFLPVVALPRAAVSALPQHAHRGLVRSLEEQTPSPVDPAVDCGSVTPGAGCIPVIVPAPEELRPRPLCTI